MKMDQYFASLARKFSDLNPGGICDMLEQRVESCDEAGKTFVCSYPVRKWMVNANSFLHGGITAAMFDQAMGVLSMYCAKGRETPTIDIRVSFCRPVPENTRLFIRSRILGVGNTLIQTAADAYLEGEPDVIVASGCAAYHIIHNKANRQEARNAIQETGEDRS